jgi:hypothetical protein
LVGGIVQSVDSSESFNTYNVVCESVFTSLLSVVVVPEWLLCKKYVPGKIVLCSNNREYWEEMKYVNTTFDRFGNELYVARDDSGLLRVYKHIKSIPKRTHTIIVDGEEIKISEESFKQLKLSLLKD